MITIWNNVRIYKDEENVKMAINIAPKSLDTELSELMRDVTSGKVQLPEFQRSWTWDDRRIRGILASLSQGYPMGAIMRLE